ncbi:MAG: YybS family protein [Peptococcaceae bacterium]|jgi:hypothetical protein|nr:YybS family protein [Peptococcaceae bacterium]
MAQRNDGLFFYLGVLILLVFPWLGLTYHLWGWVVDVSLLLSVFGVGYRLGWIAAAVLLASGYAVAAGVFGFSGVETLSFTPVAGVFGLWIRRWLPGNVAFFWSVAVAAALTVFPFLRGFPDMMNESLIRENVDFMMQMYQTTGLFATLQQQGMTEIMIRQRITDTLALYLQLTPALTAIAGMMTYGMAYYILRRFYGGWNRAVPFVLWRFPKKTLWGVNAAIILFLIGEQFSQPVLKLFGLNVMLVYAAVTLVLGMAVFTFFLKATQLPVLVKWGIIGFNIVLAPFSVMSIMLLGLLDLGLNFRRLPDQTSDKP